MGLNDFFIRVLCIGSVLLYAASASLISTPQIQLSPTGVAKLLKLKDNQTSDYTAETVEEQFLADRLSSRLNSLESLFRIIGSPQQPITVVIDQDRPLRVSIGVTDVVLGSRVVKSAGQLEHAVLKAWVRQVGSSEVLNNPVRAEIYTDLLWATYSGSLKLQDPQHQKLAEFVQIDNWVNDLFGTAELCNSPWRPAELISYCDGVKKSLHGAQSSYSLRKVIGSLIWNEVSELGLHQKRTVLGRLSRNIRSQAASVAAKAQDQESSEEKIDTIEQLRLSIEGEAKEIYPDLTKRLPVITPTFGVMKENSLSLLGGFEIQPSAPLNFKKMIIESCEAPTLAKLLKQTTDSTEHILLVQNCDKKQMNYSGFLQAGASRFASENRDVKFAYLHRASLKLANKMINNFDIEAALAFDPTSKDAKFLGLDQKIFREDVGAYKVDGPIGAIEWYRSELNPKNS